MAAMFALAATGCAAVSPNFNPPAAPSTRGYVPRGKTPAATADNGAAPSQTTALGEKVAGDWWTRSEGPLVEREE